MRFLLGLGGNIGDVRAAFDSALASLNALPSTSVLRTSPRYVTAPEGYADQPDFLNMVAEVASGLSPHALLGACLGIEAALGRRRSFPNAPRPIDLDLLLAEGFSCKTPELTLPHPRMARRAFVLTPLRDLYPDGVVYGVRVADGHASCPSAPSETGSP